MALEIERKFLVADTSFMAEATEALRIRQGYLSLRPESTVRIRIKGPRAFLTVKGLNNGPVRHEWEYEVPLADAEQMFALCEGTTVDKVRHLVPGPDGHIWEVDVFASPVDGLMLAEVELPSADAQVALPPWLGAEVTDDPRYFNSAIARGSLQ